MSLLKEIPDRGATTAWSPLASAPNLIAVGFKDVGSGTGFDNVGGELEIYELDLTSTQETPKRIAHGKTAARFNCIAWGGKLNLGRGGQGILAGGMQSGVVNIWDPKNVSTPLSIVAKHEKKVNSLHFNPLDSAANLLATGASDSEVYIIDLNDPAKPSVYSPAGRDSPSKHNADVSAVAWNSQVPHILASAALNGTCTVWDLREKKSWCEIRDPKGAGFTTLCWNPNQGLHLLTATDDDQRPVLRLWDLRSSTTNPLAEFAGHTKGVFSVSWCPFDNMLLMSCGKDNRTILWDLLKGIPINEIGNIGQNPQPQASLANSMIGGTAGDIFGGKSAGIVGGMSGRRYEVSWAPHLRGIISTCSFDRNIEIFSMISGGGGKPLANDRSMRAPKWLGRKAGAAFGFGGKLVNFTDLSGKTQTPTVTISTVVDSPTFSAKAADFENSLNEALAKDMEHYQMLASQHQQQEGELAMTRDNLIELCLQKARMASSEFDREVWNFMTVLFEPLGARDRISQQLGYDMEEIAKQIEAEISLPTESGESVEKPERSSDNAPAMGLGALDQAFESSDMFGKDVSDAFNAPAPGNAFDAPPPSNEKKIEERNEAIEQETERKAQLESSSGSALKSEKAYEKGDAIDPHVDDLIKKSLLVCNFGAAVQCCFENNRLGDALLLATCGGEDLWNRTIDKYLSLQMSKKPYIPILSAIIKSKLDQLVQSSDLIDGKWKEILAIVTQYAKSEEFPYLCEKLGERLEEEVGENGVVAATLCYMCATNVEKVVEMWMKEALKSDLPSEGLQKTMEMMSVYQQGIQEASSVLGVPAVMKQYISYAEMLSQQGQLNYAASYLAQLDTSQIDPNDPKWSEGPPPYWEQHNDLSFSTLVLIDRIYGAHPFPEEGLHGIIPQRWFPFTVQQINIAPEESQQTSSFQYADNSVSPGSQPQFGTQQSRMRTSQAQTFGAYQEPKSQVYAPPPSSQTVYQSEQPPIPPGTLRDKQRSIQQIGRPQPNIPANITSGQVQPTQTPYSMQPSLANTNGLMQQKSTGPPKKAIPVNDGFGSTAGNPPAGANYGNVSQAKPNHPAPAPGAGNMHPPFGQPTSAPQNPTGMMLPGMTRTTHSQGVETTKPEVQPPEPAPVKREMPPGMQSVITSLKQLCEQIQGMQLTPFEAKQLKEGQKAVETLNEKLMTGKIPDHLQTTLKDFGLAIASYNLNNASQLRLGMTRTSWAEQKDWLKGLTIFLNLAVKKFPAQ